MEMLFTLKSRILPFLFICLFFINSFADESCNVIEFKTLPNSIKTNIPAFPVTGQLLETTKTLYVNDVNTPFDPVGLDFFAVMDLEQGLNTITIKISDVNGGEVAYSKTIEYDSNYSTRKKELIYANVRYIELNNSIKSFQDGVLVIDTKEDVFLGIIKNQGIFGITKDGSEIILKNGMRYSTENHSYTGKNLPNVTTSSYKLLFSNDGQFVYHRTKKISLELNSVVTNLPVSAEIGYQADITNDDNRIVIPNGCIEIDNNTFIPLDYMNGAMDIWADIAVDPTGKYVLTTSYSSARGRLNILTIEDANLLKTFYDPPVGNYAGDIVFSPNGEKAYVGCYGNTWYAGNGGIMIVDMNTLGLDNKFMLHGPRSLVVSEDGNIYASAFFTLNAGHYEGNRTLRGIVGLAPIDDANNLEIKKVFFASLLSTTNEPYYGRENIFYKPGKPVSDIEFTDVPPYGSDDNLKGRVLFKEPNDCNNYAVAVYILVPPYGWWTKPQWAWLPTNTVDCNWICDIVTGGQDKYATEIIAFLVPKDSDPPLASGQQCLPMELYQFPYTKKIRYEKINFAGLEWWIKRHKDPVGPGPNYFSDSNENVWVDPNGYLHLNILQSGGNWYCSEVIANTNLGYGTYIFTIKGRVDLLDENIILGLFTWEDCVPQHNYREIDFEFSKWGNPNEPNNGQYVIQPWTTKGNMYRFAVDNSKNDTTTHVFTWSQNQILFNSYYGDFSLTPNPNDFIASWRYTGNDIPPAGSENPRINFWLMNGYAPSDGQNAEIVIKNFQYLPEVN